MKITIIQPDLFWEDKLSNLAHLGEMIHGIPENTDLIILPETFTTGFSMNAEGLAEGKDGNTMEWMKNIAKTRSTSICGSFIAREGDLFFNRFVFADPSGRVCTYDKRHLFSIGGENKSFTAGKSRQLFTYMEMRINPVICYDLRFPVWLRNRNDYDLLICVANWPESRRDVWKTLLKARAIENQAYVAGVSRVGTDRAGNRHAGESIILDPMGKTIVDLPEFKEGVATAEISKKNLDDFRSKFPVWKDADDFTLI